MNQLPPELQNIIFQNLDNESILNLLIVEGRPLRERPRLQGSFSFSELRDFQRRLNLPYSLNDLVDLRFATLYTTATRIPLDWYGIEVRDTVQFGDLEYPLEAQSVDASDLDISVLPDGLRYMEDLIYLNLSNNRISELPELYLPSLQVLDLSDNVLQDFPDLSGFPNLRYLNLSNNSISWIPEWLSHDYLEYLDIQLNDVRNFLTVSQEKFPNLQTFLIS